MISATRSASTACRPERWRVVHARLGRDQPGDRPAIADRRELDLWVQYRPSDGPLKGLRVRTHYSEVWQDGNVRNPQPEFRFIVDYTVLFRPPSIRAPRRGRRCRR